MFLPSSSSLLDVLTTIILRLFVSCVADTAEEISGLTSVTLPEESFTEFDDRSTPKGSDCTGKLSVFGFPLCCLSPPKLNRGASPETKIPVVT
jgi:hypothetical protein